MKGKTIFTDLNPNGPFCELVAGVIAEHLDAFDEHDVETFDFEKTALSRDGTDGERIHVKQSRLR